MKVSTYQDSKGRWVVDHYLAGKRTRKYFQSKNAAAQEASILRGEISRSGADSIWLSLDDDARVELAKVIREIRASGLTLAKVWADYQAGAAIPQLPSKTVGEAIRECLASKLSANRRSNYVDSLEYYLSRFGQGREQLPMASLTTSDVEQFLTQFDSLWTRSTWLNRISTLFAFAVRREWLVSNPCSKIERISIDVPAPQILSVDEAIKLMQFVEAKLPNALAWSALALFAGIRPEEADRVEWSAIDLTAGLVTISAAAAKVRQRRIIHLEPNAVAWLARSQAIEAPLPLAYVTRRRYIRAIRDFMGWESWPKDILRHSAASYLMALYQDAGKVADRLGNSAAVLLRHYRELVRQEEAKKFFAIMPLPTGAAS